MAEAERFQGVQQHDVQVAAEAAVLKTVVQHDRPATERPNGLPGGGHAIRILHVRHVRERQPQFQGLVVGRKKGTVPDQPSVGARQNGPKGALHKWGLSPFLVRPVAPAYQCHVNASRPNQRASHSTSGVLPVPPSVRLPTLTTGTSTRKTFAAPRSNRRFRHRTAAV